jgi:hypothetical protein
VLNLPPGWKLFAASGIDGVEGVWFDQWSLLDFFIVLIITLSVYKLWSWEWGLISLMALGLSYHEPGAPQLIWLNLLAALALLRFLPDGWAKKNANFLRLGSIIFLLILATPFIVQRVRWALYPQLEKFYSPRYDSSPSVKMSSDVREVKVPPPETVVPELLSPREVRLPLERDEKDKRIPFLWDR